MKRYVLPMLALPFVLASCGNSNSPEGIANDAIASLKQISAALDGVKDEASAKAALPSIQTAMTQYKSLEAKFTALKDAPAMEQMKATASMMGPMVELATKFQTLKQQYPAAAKILDAEFAKLGK